MKKIFIIIATLMLNLSLVKAQDPDFPPAGTNFPNPTLDQFVGTWVWANGTDTLKIKLKKVNYLDMTGYYRDSMIGYHYYKKEGTVIENSFNFSNSSYTDKKHTILVDNDNGLGENILTGGIDDLTKKKGAFIRLEVNLAQHTMVFTRKGYAGLRYNVPTGFTLPNNITLTKQP